MQMPVFDPSVSSKDRFRRILLLYCGLATLSLSVSFLSGVFKYSSSFALPYFFVGWTYSVTIGLVLDYGRRMSVPPKNGRAYRILFLAPAVTQMAQDAVRSLNFFRSDSFSFVQPLFLMISVLDLSIAIISLVLLRSVYIAHTNRAYMSVVESKSPSQLTKILDPRPQALQLCLGQAMAILIGS